MSGLCKICSQGDLGRSSSRLLSIHRQAVANPAERLIKSSSPVGLLTTAYRRGARSRLEGSFTWPCSRQVVELPPMQTPERPAGSSLGDPDRERHDFTEASKNYHQALEIRERLAPASTGYAESLAALAGVLRDQQHPDESARLYAQAIDVLENQVAHLGGSNAVRRNFRATRADIYSSYAGLLLAQKQTELAFQVVERSRARTLLEMLFAAHVDIRQGADPSLLARAQELQAALTAKSNRKIQLLQGKHTEE